MRTACGARRSCSKGAANLDFEEAARLRDLVGAIRTMQARQYVDGRAADLDVLAIAMQDSSACVVLMAFRDGRNLGTRSFFPKTNGSDQPDEVLGAFVSQHYIDQLPPREIVIDRDILDRELLEQALSMSGNRKVQIRCSVRGERAGYLDIARRNAQMALASEMTSAAAQRRRVESLRDLLGMDEVPNRIECFDISHTMGEATVASCVVFDAEGAVRSQYRRYNITGITPGDDYAAMHQAIQRRFRRAADAIEAGGDSDAARAGGRAGQASTAVLPDVLLIDGGAGQVAQARAVLDELGIEGVRLAGVSKGPERRPGDEDILLPDGRCVHPGAQSPALQLIQQVRDEAHRFAITGHRGKRQKARTSSRLEDIPGIGPRRRAALLKHFGGLGGLKAAGVEEIARVEGVNAALAQRIYDTLHGLAPADGAE
jgi:excinuclease ABC subunit C